ncbi:hypothetical protein [Peredibacter starrii]|uniref:Uncharacterized protein n=1 Tax=Peredibacter starrii TaxID=28202 RepID=A0AAX4HIY8_9BACT|nr:hypothetical protein [Peredibacter starrii]WPU63197.1 hypothetical protein SOO65_10925 [Peredibacter starrii]
MKKFIALFALSLSVSALANTIDFTFKKDSPISVELQQRLLKVLKERCPEMVQPYGLREVTTAVRIDRVDQGIIDRYYTTTFSARWYFDGYHPSTSYIEVESVEYSFQNGDNLAVLKIDGDRCN